jgi:TnpA family transposase
MPSIVTRSPLIGATALRHLQTLNSSLWAAEARRSAGSTRTTVPNRASSCTPIFPTSTGPFHSTTISATASEAPYLVDGLLYHETDLEIAEHHSDTGAFTDQIFGICQLLCFRYAPRIRDLADKRLHPFEKASSYHVLEPLIGQRINVAQIESQWDELLRLATSIRQGTVTASLVLRKLASYPR